MPGPDIQALAPQTHAHKCLPLSTYRAVEVIGIPEAVKSDLGDGRHLLSTSHGGPIEHEGDERHAPIVGQSRKGGLALQIWEEG